MPLPPESLLYLRECLESQWNMDSEYLPTRADKESAWRSQNAVRLLADLPPLSYEDLEAAYGDKPTRDPVASDGPVA